MSDAEILEVRDRARELWWGRSSDLIDELVRLLADMRLVGVHAVPAAMLENVLTEGFR